MLTRLSHDRRRLIYPSLIVWWLWSTMALCYAQSFAAAEGAVRQPSMTHGSTMGMHEQLGAAATHVDHSAANTAHNCCYDSAVSSCCDTAEALKTKSTPDIDLQFVAVLLSWLFVLSEPVLSSLPSDDIINSHTVTPRLHLLLCVFLD